LGNVQNELNTFGLKGKIKVSRPDGVLGYVVVC
jgi:hypothetical protein